MDLVLSQSGRVHRTNCRHRGRSAPWDWATRASREQVAKAAFESGYAICQHCRPFSLELDNQERSRVSAFASSPPGVERDPASLDDLKGHPYWSAP